MPDSFGAVSNKDGGCLGAPAVTVATPVPNCSPFPDFPLLPAQGLSPPTACGTRCSPAHAPVHDPGGARQSALPGADFDQWRQEPMGTTPLALVFHTVPEKLPLGNQLHLPAAVASPLTQPWTGLPCLLVPFSLVAPLQIPTSPSQNKLPAPRPCLRLSFWGEAKVRHFFQHRTS